MPGTLESAELRGELGMLLDALPEPALLLSLDRRVLLTNRSFKKRFGAGATENRPPCYRLLHGQTQACAISGETCPVDLCCETGRPSRSLHVHSSREGAQHVDVRVRPIVDESGRIDSFLQILRPVEIASARPSERGLVGRTKVFNRMLDDIERVAPTPCPVLLVGEPGTGKEEVARAIHRRSSRAGGPFVPVDCSSLRETLFEREAFGHTRGAYPGAEENGSGLVTAAEEGTLFLDDVSELPLTLQARFLRLVETGLYRREGSAELLRADFRIVSASDKDLEALSVRGLFRPNLLLALSAFRIRVPPLRERPGDIPLIAASLLERLRANQESLRLHPTTIQALKAYHFPGNIRELHSILERACLLTDGPELLPWHLPGECRQEVEGGPSGAES